MNRRTFLKGLGLVVSGIAIEQAVPLGKVFSFPKEIVCVNRFQGSFAELLKPGIHDLYVNHWLTSKSAWYVDTFGTMRVSPDLYKELST